MRASHVVCLVLLLPLIAEAQEAVAQDAVPVPSDDVAPAEPAPSDAPSPSESPPPAAPAEAAASPPPVARPVPAAEPVAPAETAPPARATTPAVAEAPGQAAPPAPTPPTQTQTPKTFVPPASYSPPQAAHPHSRTITVAPPPWVYTPQQSPLVGDGQPGQPAPPSVSWPQTTYTVQPVAPTYAPSVVLPQLPPGYAYVPAPLPPIPQTQLAPVDGPRREKLFARLQQVSAKMYELEHQRVGVGGPIVAMVLGYGTMAVASVVGLSAAESARQVKRNHYESDHYDRDLDFNDDGDVDRSDRRNWVKTARVGAGLSAAGFLIGLAGTAGLQHARELRQKNQKELSQLREEQASLRRQLDYGPQLSSNQIGFTVRGHY